MLKVNYFWNFFLVSSILPKKWTKSIQVEVPYLVWLIFLLLCTCAHDCNRLPISFSHLFSEIPNSRRCWRLKPFPLATYLYLNDKLRDLYNEWRKADLIKNIFQLGQAVHEGDLKLFQNKQNIQQYMFQNKHRSMLTFQKAASVQFKSSSWKEWKKSYKKIP